MFLLLFDICCLIARSSCSSVYGIFRKVRKYLFSGYFMRRKGRANYFLRKRTHPIVRTHKRAINNPKRPLQSWTFCQLAPAR